LEDRASEETAVGLEEVGRLARFWPESAFLCIAGEMFVALLCKRIMTGPFLKLDLKNPQNMLLK
jgi:hypothetical protein